MITPELITSNIPDLQPEVVSKFVELSQNIFKNEQTKIRNTAAGETFGLIDKTLAELGFEKPEGIKTTDFLKNAFENVNKKAAESYSQQVENLKSEIAELKKGDKGRADLEKQLADLQNEHKKVVNEYTEKLTAKEKEFKSNVIKTQILQNLPSFNGVAIGEALLNVAKENAISQIMQSADLDESGNVVFRNDKGELLTNPKNLAKPMTIADMIAENKLLSELLKPTQKGVNIPQQSDLPQKQLNLSGVTTKAQFSEYLDNLAKLQNIKPSEIADFRAKIIRENRSVYNSLS